MKKNKYQLFLLLMTLGIISFAYPFIHKPFSFRAEDTSHSIIFHNDFEEAFSLYSQCAQACTNNQHTLEDSLEDALSQIIIKVNKKTIKNGQRTTLYITTLEPLTISMIAPTSLLIDYLLTFDFVDGFESNIIKTLSTTFFKYTGCLFNNKTPEEMYFDYRKFILYTLMRTYRHTIGLFGATCEVQVTLSAEKIIELIQSADSPIISFHDVFDVIAQKSLEPERWIHGGNYYKAIIKII